MVVVFGFELGALFGNFGFDAVYVVADVDAIGDGLDVGVFGDEVFIKEAEGGFAGGGGEADEEGVKIIEDLAPEIVDRAVAFIDHDDIEGFDGDARVVADGEGLFGGVGAAALNCDNSSASSSNWSLLLSCA